MGEVEKREFLSCLVISQNDESRVLVVDLAKALELAPVHVVSAFREADQYLFSDASLPGIVIVDDSDQNLISEIEHLRSQDAADMPVILLTESSDARQYVDWIRAGISEIIRKPLNSACLLESLQTWILHKRHMDDLCRGHSSSVSVPNLSFTLPSSPMRVLLIDEDVQSNSLIAQALTASHLTFCIETNYEQGIVRAIQEIFPLILFGFASGHLLLSLFLF